MNPQSPFFTPETRGWPGPTRPLRELIAAIVAMKQRDPNWGCPKIAHQFSLVFEMYIDEDIVRRVLARSPRIAQRRRYN